MLVLEVYLAAILFSCANGYYHNPIEKKTYFYNGDNLEDNRYAVTPLTDYHNVLNNMKNDPSPFLQHVQNVLAPQSAMLPRALSNANNDIHAQNSETQDYYSMGPDNFNHHGLKLNNLRNDPTHPQFVYDNGYPLYTKSIGRKGNNELTEFYKKLILEYEAQILKGMQPDFSNPDLHRAIKHLSKLYGLDDSKQVLKFPYWLIPEVFDRIFDFRMLKNKSNLKCSNSQIIPRTYSPHDTNVHKDGSLLKNSNGYPLYTERIGRNGNDVDCGVVKRFWIGSLGRIIGGIIGSRYLMSKNKLDIDCSQPINPVGKPKEYQYVTKGSLLDFIPKDKMYRHETNQGGKKRNILRTLQTSYPFLGQLPTNIIDEHHDLPTKLTTPDSNDGYIVSDLKREAMDSIPQVVSNTREYRNEYGEVVPDKINVDNDDNLLNTNPYHFV